MGFCPMPHTSRDQVWLGVGVGLGAAFSYWCGRVATAPSSSSSSSSTAQIVGTPFDPAASTRSPSVESSAGARLQLATIRDAPLSKEVLAAANGDHCVVSSARLDVNAVVNEVVAAGAGGVALFIGTTRDNFNGRPVEQLEYEAYDSMATKEMRKVCAAMRARHTTNGGLHKVAIVHRVGECPVCEPSVIVACSSAHRLECLEAAAFGIDQLKRTVPVWKKERYGDRGDEGSSGSGGDSQSKKAAEWKQNKEWKEFIKPQ